MRRLPPGREAHAPPGSCRIASCSRPADANLIFLTPGSVVAELCPLGYCTNSYERISPLLGLTYLRWTNSIQANARKNFDTVVDEAQFLALMKRAAQLWRAG